MSGALFRRRSADAFRPISASGGIETTITVNGRQFRVHSFTTVGTSSFVVSNAGTERQIEYLVVGGGGGGSRAEFSIGGGGGAGGMVEGTAQIVATTYVVEVGAGGVSQSNGTRSRIVGIAQGDRGVRGRRTPGLDGPSGAGGGSTIASGGMPGGSGTPPQGNDGGDGFFDNHTLRGGGGGGGAGAAGANGTISGGGNGGAGRASSIRTGQPVFYAGGGGGGARGASGGNGGVGGGASSGANNTVPAPATPNTGGGGAGTTVGASGSNVLLEGGNGGSGIVVIRYPLERA